MRVRASKYFCDDVSYLNGVQVRPRGPGSAILSRVL
jgi:hypothetical protein